MLRPMWLDCNDVAKLSRLMLATAPLRGNQRYCPKSMWHNHSNAQNDRHVERLINSRSAAAAFSLGEP